MLGEDCPIPLTHVENIRATGTPFFRSPERAFRALAALTRLSNTPVAITPAARSAGATARVGHRSRIPREAIARASGSEDASGPPRAIAGRGFEGCGGDRVSACAESTVEPPAAQIGSGRGGARHSRWRVVAFGLVDHAGPTGCRAPRRGARWDAARTNERCGHRDHCRRAKRGRLGSGHPGRARRHPARSCCRMWS